MGAQVLSPLGARAPGPFGAPRTCVWLPDTGAQVLSPLGARAPGPFGALRTCVWLPVKTDSSFGFNRAGQGPGICISMLPGGEMLLLWDHALRTTCLGREALGQHHLDLYSVFHLQTEF